MADGTKIEWTDATWNPVRAWTVLDDAADETGGRVGWHCEHASEGCRNCYAEAINRRLGTGLEFKPGHRGKLNIAIDEKLLLAPLRWRRPRTIFVGSMTDLFADFVTDAMLDRIFAVMALCPQHRFQLLTKRSARMREYLNDCAGDWSRLDAIWSAIADLVKGGIPLDPEREIDLPLPNVWLGVSVEDQAAADSRIPDLLVTPAAVRFLSCEPLLGPVDIDCPDINWGGYPEGGGIQGDRLIIDWVIAGGESGRGARPMHPDWARSLRDQCAAAGVPFFFKQWGEWAPVGGLYDDDGDTDETIAAENALFGARGRTFENGDFWTDPTDVQLIDSSMYNWANENAQPPSDVIVIKRRGKKAAGRLLDGVTHDGMPG